MNQTVRFIPNAILLTHLRNTDRINSLPTEQSEAILQLATAFAEFSTAQTQSERRAECEGLWAEIVEEGSCSSDLSSNAATPPAALSHSGVNALLAVLQCVGGSDAMASGGKTKESAGGYVEKLKIVVAYAQQVRPSLTHTPSSVTHTLSRP